MEGSDNPYEILGLDPSASPNEVKRAYRQAALRHHPDRQTSEADKQRAHAQFAKVSNAYELLSDPTQRRQYDLQQQQPDLSDMMWPPGGGLHDFVHSSFHQHHPFHDPFQVFEQVFREEFGNGRSGMFPPQHRPFGSSMMGSLFDDPFLSGGGFGGIGGGGLGRHPSRGGGGMDPFDNMLSSMMRPPPPGADGGAPLQNSQVFFSSSSTTSGGGGGESVSTSTTTRIVNGKRETVTERVVRHADGRVERTVQSSNGDGSTPAAAIENGHAKPAASIENGQGDDPEPEPQHKRRGLLSWAAEHVPGHGKKRPKATEEKKEEHHHDEDDAKRKHKRKQHPSHHESDS